MPIYTHHTKLLNKSDAAVIARSLFLLTDFAQVAMTQHMRSGMGVKALYKATADFRAKLGITDTWSMPICTDIVTMSSCGYANGKDGAFYPEGPAVKSMLWHRWPITYRSCVLTGTALIKLPFGSVRFRLTRPIPQSDIWTGSGRIRLIAPYVTEFELASAEEGVPPQ